MARNHYHSFLSKVDNRVDLCMSLEDFKGLFIACMCHKEISSSLDWFVKEYRYLFDNI